MFKDSFFEKKILNSLVYPVLDSSDIGISISDAAGNIIEVNRAFCDLFGCSKEEAVGEKFFEIVKEENAEESVRLHDEFMQNGYYDQREVLLSTRDGKLFYAKLVDIKLNDDQGNVFRTTTYTDITEKKYNDLAASVLLKVPQMVNASEPMDVIYENLNNSIRHYMSGFSFYIALYDDETDSITYPYLAEQNESLRNMQFRETITEYILKNGNSSLITEEKLRNIMDKYDETDISDLPKNVIGAVLRIMGKTAGAVVIMDHGNKSAFSRWHLNTIERIAQQLSYVLEMKKYEEELNSTKEKAQESEKIKSSFLTQMSHEVRTPINTILSFAWLLKEKFGDDADEEVEEYYTIIENGGKRLIRTMDMILNMSLLENEDVEIRRDKFDITSKVLKPLYQEASKAAKIKNINLTLECASGEDRIVGDEDTVKQMFEQLIDNAIKYTDKGTVNIRQFKNETGATCISIKDTGVGMSRDYVSRLFTPFSQEETGYTRSYEGNGLGLALVKKLTELNNASITVQSEKGRGSEFTVIFNN